MRRILTSIEGEYRRYKKLGEGAFDQVTAAELVARSVTRGDLDTKWEEGWSILFRTLADLDDGALDRRVTIRGEEMSVLEALHRSLAHASYHVGQIVLLAKSFRGASWKSLSIPKGGIRA